MHSIYSYGANSLVGGTGGGLGLNIGAGKGGYTA
jgi:hypothetical protein